MLIMQILLLLQQLGTHEKFVKAIVFVIIIFDLQCKLTLQGISLCSKFITLIREK